MPTAIMMFGLPGSGKSTWIKDNIAKYVYDIGPFQLVSADELKERSMSTKSVTLTHEQSVDAAEQIIYENIASGRDMIIDSGGINNNYTKRILGALKDYNVKLVHIDTPYQVCLERNALRDRAVPVPQSNIIKKAVILEKCLDSLRKFENVEYVHVPYYTRKHVFCDLDGTVAALQRLPVGLDSNIDFVNGDVFRLAKPMHPVIDAVYNLWENDSNIYILSASPNSICSADKRAWVSKYMGFIDPNDVYFVGNKDWKIVMLQSLMQQFKIKPQDCSIIDDWAYPLREAEKLGVEAIHPSMLLV